MYPELIIVIGIIIFIVIYTKAVKFANILDLDNPYISYIKEDDYDFLLVAKYGDLVYNPNEVFMGTFHWSAHAVTY